MQLHMTVRIRSRKYARTAPGPSSSCWLNARFNAKLRKCWACAQSSAAADATWCTLAKLMRKSTCERVAGAEGWWQVALGQLQAWHVQVSPDRAVVRAHALGPQIRSSEVLHKGFALRRHAMVDTRLLKPLGINQGLLLSICLLSAAESAQHSSPLCIVSPYIVVMHL